MIKLTYEYYCDVCEDEIREKHVYKIHPLQGSAVPVPAQVDYVGTYQVCFGCRSVAYTALHARLKEQK